MKELLKKTLHYSKRKLERCVNQLHSHDYADAWPIVVSPDSVVGGGDLGTVFDPYVVWHEGLFRLFASKRSDSSLVCFISRDGKSWGSPVVSLAPGGLASEWDERVNRACVLKAGDAWLMWYTGQKSGKSSVGIAKSDDGIRFERFLEGPVLAAERLHEGASVMNPCVLADGLGGFRMWYAAGEDYEPDVICEARSRDGVHWVKRGAPVLRAGSEPYDHFKVGGCHVIRLSPEKLAMFYIGYQNLDVARMCLALSDDDGETWRRSPLNPLISPKKGTWRSDAVYKPGALIDDEGVLRIWFNARSGRVELIGSASARASEVLRFE